MVSLLAVGVVALAENGFGGKDSADWAAARAAGECTCDGERDADGDGTPNCEDSDFVRPRCRATEEACVTAVATACAMGVATATVPTDRTSIII
jgi:hypothetical protein